PKISYVFPPDDRSRVVTTSNYPWRTICKLYSTAADDTHWIGSGAIIDEFHLLTCGHVVYIHDHGGWVDELEIVPGMDSSNRPYGRAFATNYRSYTGWTQSNMSEHDWAVVTLDRSIGDFTGWMGRVTAPSTDPIYTGTVYTAGYPGDLNNGEVMYQTSDNGEDADAYNHWYWLDSAGGQSGSPVWYVDGGSRYIMTIHAYEYEGGVYANFGTRINSDKFDQIDTWLSQDSSSPPNDKAELLDRGVYSGISKSELVSGQTPFTIYCDVKNEGTLTATSFSVSFYASEDLMISTFNDHLIGSSYITNLAPFEYKTADWSGIFPSEIPVGDYYVGWIIDGDNEIAEFDETNNIVSNSNLLVSVVPSPPNMLLVAIIIPIVLIAVAVVLIFLLRSIHSIPDMRIDYDFSFSN
ncbi:MAG: CARDB domain-containing protein, partial [Promethearchaeota archaeon]